jgi:hypothetical protein
MFLIILGIYFLGTRDTPSSFFLQETIQSSEFKERWLIEGGKV